MLRKETSYQWPTRIVLVEDEQHGEYSQLLSLRRKIKYENFFKYFFFLNFSHQPMLPLPRI